MARPFIDWLTAVFTRAGFGRDWYLMVVAACIGLVIGLLSMAYVAPMHWVIDWIGDLEPSRARWVVPLIPVGGALLAGIILHCIKSEAPGLGVTRTMYAIYRRGGRIPFRAGIRKWLASTCTIASGGSAGVEGPIVTIGSVVGSNVGQLLGMRSQNTATLLGCGAAAGLASVFNAPIAGVFFVMEILLRDFSLRTFTPIIIASVISAAVTQAMVGNGALFAAGSEFSYDAFMWQEIGNYLVLGLLCGIVAVCFIRTLYAVVRWVEGCSLHPVFRPVVGAALLGGLGYGWLLLGGEGDDVLPRFFGNGYPAVRDMLAMDSYDIGSANQEGVIILLGSLLLLGVLKAIATVLTIGSGGAGGLFAPSLFLGAAIGGCFGIFVNSIGWFPTASPAHYALVGMASMVAATTHAPLTAILIVYEITRSYEVILPLMLAAVISTIVARLIYRDSIYSVPLSGLGVRVGGMSDLTILRRLSVGDVSLVAPVFVHPNDSADRLLQLSEQLSVHDYVVTDHRNRYLGMVTGDDLKEALVYREAIPLLQVSELQRSDLPAVSPDQTLDEVLDIFARHDVDSLVVVADTGDIMGLVNRSRLMLRYQQALSSEA